MRSATNSWVLRSLVAAAALSLACGGADATAPAKPKAAPVAAAEAPPAKPDAKPAPGVQDDGTVVPAFDWFHGSVEQAKAKAQADGKLIFAKVGAYWCPPCNELDEKTFVDPAVGAFLLQHYVPLHIDAEKGEGPDFVERYHVQGYPTMLVLQADGVEKGRLVDFQEPKELLERLTRLNAGGNVLADLKEAMDAAPDDAEKRYRYAHALALGAQREEADALFDQVLLADPKNEQGLAARVLSDRAMFFKFKLDKDLDGAIAAFRELQKKYPDSKQATGAYRQIARIQHKQGKTAEALASMNAMLATDAEDVGLMSSFGWFSFRERCEPEAGLAVVRKGIAKEPERAGLHYLAAELEHQLGNHAGAVDAIRKASAAEPDSAYYNRPSRRCATLA